MSDPTALAPSITLISAGSRLDAHAKASTDDDHALERFASWLAEVSAEAAQQPHASREEPPVAEPAS